MWQLRQSQQKGGAISGEELAIERRRGYAQPCALTLLIVESTMGRDVLCRGTYTLPVLPRPPRDRKEAKNLW
jgi:hypothetical protein